MKFYISAQTSLEVERRLLEIMQDSSFFGKMQLRNDNFVVEINVEPIEQRLSLRNIEWPAKVG